MAERTAGQGTIGMEILRQTARPIHAVFVPIGGGGLASGIAAYMKRLSPDVEDTGGRAGGRRRDGPLAPGGPARFARLENPWTTWRMTTAGGGRRSRRLSATSSRSSPEPLEQVVFFVDRSLGRKRFPAPLRDAGFIVEIHDDHFAPDAEDEVWLAEIGKRGWVAITKDERIRYRAIEREALMRARVRAFILTGRDMPVFLRCLPRVQRSLPSTTGPSSRESPGAESST
jgi:hypothetical protein